MILDVSPCGALRGTLRVPGDKSISHRAVLFSAMANGVSRLDGVLDSADVRSTIEAVRTLGARVRLEPAEDGSLCGEIEGWGEAGPVREPVQVDCGNSGTTARLLLGALAGWPGVDATLHGDASLSRRPMGRVTAPLEAMGARFGSAEDTLPVRVLGDELSALDYASPVASAQVKTAVLLAGTRAPGVTRVTEPAPSRDHTERMLPAFGVPVAREAWREGASGPAVSLRGPVVPAAADVEVAADPSSAAFVACTAVLVEGSDVTLTGVSLNPTRIGWVRVLERMGADITVTPSGERAGEPVGAIAVRGGAALTATRIEPVEVPSLIDEIPVLAIVAARAEGTTVFAGVGELRVKESDRLGAIERGLAALGVEVGVDGERLEVVGAEGFSAAELDSLGDHRLAMAWTVAGTARGRGAAGIVSVARFEAVDVSYPGFVTDLGTLGAW